MVKRRPAPNVDPAAAAAFIEAADAPVSQAPAQEVRTSAPKVSPAEPLAAPGPRPPAPTSTPGETLPASMLLRFKEPRDEARMIATLAEHYDRSKQYIAYAALVRGLQAMTKEAGLS